MSSPKEDYCNRVLTVESQWISYFAGNTLNTHEFDELLKHTLDIILDFRMVIFPDTLSEELNTRFNKMLSNIEALAYVDRWNTPHTLCLLSGKLIWRRYKREAQFERRLLQENDQVISARIQAVMNLFQNTDCEEVNQIVINTLETYKKFLVCEMDLQNKLSYATIEQLMHSLMIIFSYKKDYGHLHSLISTLPEHEKLKFVLAQANTVPDVERNQKIDKQKQFITFCIFEDLLQKEFKKSRNQQNILNYNLYISILIDISLRHEFVDRMLEKLVLSASNMNVVSDYYYLVANLLRLKMPNKHKSLIIKLYSIGLSHDLSLIEKIKYEHGGRKEEFIKSYRKMFLALLTLGLIIDDYELRRLCIKAASACELETTICKEILSNLPESFSVKTECKPKLKKTLTYLRDQLETFQSAIKNDESLPWETLSVQCFEKLEFLSGRLLSDDLKPLEYPGVERLNKRAPQTDENEKVEINQQDFRRVVADNNHFNATLGSRFIMIKNPYVPTSEMEPPSDVRGLILHILQKSKNYFTTLPETRDVFANIPSIDFNQMCYYRNYWAIKQKQYYLENQQNLLFDFGIIEQESSGNELYKMYQTGNICVWNLASNGYNTYDIENIMVYAIMEKKLKFCASEFIELNKNRNIYMETSQNQINAAFNYVVCRGQPEVARFQRVTHPTIVAASMLELNLDNYMFDATPGKYRYIKRNNKSGAAASEDTEINELDANLDNSVTQMDTAELPQNEMSNATPENKKPEFDKLLKELMPTNGQILTHDISPTAIEQQINVTTSLPMMPTVATGRQKKDGGPVVMLSGDETFDASDDLIAVFLLLENDLSLMAGDRVTIDLEPLKDSTSVHKLGFTKSNNSSTVSLKFQKRRNSKQVPLIIRNLTLPARVHGMLTILMEVTDEIVYNEKNDNPFIRSTYNSKVIGQFKVDYTTQNVRLDLDVTINSFKSKLKCVFKTGVSNRRPPKNPTNPQLNLPFTSPELIKSEPTETPSALSIPAVPLYFDTEVQTIKLEKTPMTMPSLQEVYKDEYSANNINQTDTIDNSFHSYQQPSDQNSFPVPRMSTSMYNQMSLKPQFMENAYAPPRVNPLNVIYQKNLNHDPFAHPISEQNHLFNTSTIYNPSSSCQRIKTELQSPDRNESLNVNGNYSVIKHTSVQNCSSPPTPLLTNHSTSPVRSITVNQTSIISQSPDKSAALSSLPLKAPKIEVLSIGNILLQSLSNHVIVKSEAVFQNGCSTITNDPTTAALFANGIKKENPIKEEPLEQKVIYPKMKVPNFNGAVSTNGTREFRTNGNNPLVDFEREIPSYSRVEKTVSLTMAQSVQQTPPTSPPPLVHFEKISMKDIPVTIIRDNSKLLLNPFTSKVSKVLKNVSAMACPSKESKRDISAERLMNNTPPEDVIDLTKETDPDFIKMNLKGNHQQPASRTYSKKHRSRILNQTVEFVSCAARESDANVLSRSATIDELSFKESFAKVLKKIKLKSRPRMGPSSKRQHSPSISSSELKRRYPTKECEVRLVNVMQFIDKSNLKTNMTVNTNIAPVRLPLKLKPRIRRSDIVIQSHDLDGQDPLDYATDIYQSTFHLIYHNQVSYTIDGDGITNALLKSTNQCNATSNGTNCKTKNVVKSYNLARIKCSKFSSTSLDVNSKFDNNIEFPNNSNCANDSDKSLLNAFADIYLSKVIYSDKNSLNFTKNLKNQRKFCRLSVKLNNADEKLIENNDKKETDPKDANSLCQISRDVLNAVPGMHSLEFFQFPSSPKTTVQVEVVHILKNGTLSVTGDANDVSDNSAANKNPSNSQSEATSSFQNASTSGHIQKFAQTNSNREVEMKTIQTSFGTIIKNTYPPATNRTVGNESAQKSIKLKNEIDGTRKIVNNEISTNNINKANNVKIIACTSNSVQSEAQKINKNQTLINMLTQQQAMMPGSANRHYIITTSKTTDVMRPENCMTTISNLQNLQKKATISTSSGQSQLVQILNSPPSNFTVKPNFTTSYSTTMTTTSPQTKPISQVVTVASPGNSNSFKAELPAAAKQHGIVQFICKTDGKIIHLTPICSSSAGGTTKKITYKVDTSGAKGPTILHQANQQILINSQLKKSDNQNILTIIQKQDDSERKQQNKIPLLAVVSSSSSSAPTSPMSTRSIYEETYAKFIQTSSSSKTTEMGSLTISSSPITAPIASTTVSSIIQKIGKTVIQSSNQILPKFNQAFGKTVFPPSVSQESLMKNKVFVTKELITSRPTLVSLTESKPIAKITKAMPEMSDSEKQLPTLHTALQNSLLYARPIGNGKLLASNSNNVLLTALRNNQNNNVRIISTMSDSQRSCGNTIMAPMRISVPIQIPQLINTVRPQSPGNFRQQIVIATTPTRIQQTATTSISQQQHQQPSKLETLLMTAQQASKQEIEVEQNSKIDSKSQKKNVDNSTLEQLREFDMVLEQVLERSSVTPNSITSPSRSDTASPSKRQNIDLKSRHETKSSSVSVASSSPSDSPSSSKSMSAGLKAAPKLQEDEHTAQRILDILANYKEQVRNSPDLNNKPAPRRRANPPANPPASKRKKIASSSGSLGSMKNSKQFGSNSDMMTDTMGSEEDSSCGMGSGVPSTGSINNSPRGDIDDQTDVSMDNNFYVEEFKKETAMSPQSSSSSVATSPGHNKFPAVTRRLIFAESKNAPCVDSLQSPTAKNFVITNAPQSTTTITASSGCGSIEKLTNPGSTTAVLMPGNYLLPMNVLKSGQQLAILSSNNGQKIIAVPTNQLGSQVIGSSSGTSIIFQRYVSQSDDTETKTILTQSEPGSNTYKSVRLQQSPSITYVNNKAGSSGASNTIYIRPIQNVTQTQSSHNKTIITSVPSCKPQILKQENDDAADAKSLQNNFLNDKTLITEIIQQQQQLSQTHQHPQQNFMIKFNEHQPSDPRSSSSIMFVSNPASHSTTIAMEKERKIYEYPKIKIEKLDYDGCIKEEAIIDLPTDGECSITKSPMLNTKMEVDDNTNSNPTSDHLYGTEIKIEDDHTHKLHQFPMILNSYLSKTSVGSKMPMESSNVKSSRGFLIDPSNKILMYSDRRPATIEKEFFNQKSFSEECADLGVDEPIASDLFPEADLLFDSGSPKFDQMTHESAIQVKKEPENGEILLEMNYNHNMDTEPWHFDTGEEELDGSQLDGDDGTGDEPHHKVDVSIIKWISRPLNLRLSDDI